MVPSVSRLRWSQLGRILRFAKLGDETVLLHGLGESASGYKSASPGVGDPD